MAKVPITNKRIPGTPDPARRYDTQKLQGQTPPPDAVAVLQNKDTVKETQTPILTPDDRAEVNDFLEEQRKQIEGGGKISGEQDQCDQGC